MALRAMLFDLDGTITKPLLDFAAIKREIGIAPDALILEALEGMDPAASRRAMAIVERHEEDAAARSELNEGSAALLEALRSRGIATGVITRNSERSLGIVLARYGLRFDAAICRDDAAPKPSPSGILMALERLNVGAAEAVYVGDHTIDVVAGRAAGMRTIRVTNGGRPEAAPQADYEVRCPGEIIGLLEDLDRG